MTGQEEASKAKHLILILWLSGLPANVFGQTGEFVDLFRSDDLSGWVEMGQPGAFVVNDGILRLQSPNNYPNWLRSEKQYENFVLHLEYRPAGWAEGGIYLHAPLHGNPLRSGFKIHLRHDLSDEGARSTGAISDVLAPVRLANNSGDVWNRLTVSIDWPRLKVTLNDELIHDVHMERSDALRWRLRRGYLGFEDLGTVFHFRNVRIKELPASEPEWTDLFNGEDLSGWNLEGEARWRVEGGAIVVSGGDGTISTTDTYGSFEFQTYFKTSRHANGGIYYRLTDRADEPRHYEIQIYDVPTATNPTGSIYGIVPASQSDCRSGEWCLLQLISDGPYSRVLVNGETVAESHSLTLPDSGRIGINNHSPLRIEYKGARVKSLRQ